MLNLDENSIGCQRLAGIEYKIYIKTKSSIECQNSSIVSIEMYKIIFQYTSFSIFTDNNGNCWKLYHIILQISCLSLQLIKIGYNNNNKFNDLTASKNISLRPSIFSFN